MAYESYIWNGQLIAFFALMIGIYIFNKKSNNNKNKNGTITLKVLALNTWHEGTSVNGGFDALVNVILQTKANIVLLSEIRNYKNIIFSDHIVKQLKNNGAQFYSFNSNKSPLILSKFPIRSITEIDAKSLTKCTVQVNETNITLYAAHLDYTHYACYLPRGYDGITWKKLPSPILDIDKILQQNTASGRPKSIDTFIENALHQKKNGNLIIFGGDFNEPSHLDWTEAMKYKFDHNGTVIQWNCSNKLLKSGFVDVYRQTYPNPVTHPGITWPAYNKHAEFKKLIWAADADERERIDFIYYYPDDRINIDDVIIVGPVESIANGKITETNPGYDKFCAPKVIWPSDHKGILATFTLTV